MPQTLNSKSQRYTAGKRIALLGIAANIALLVLKLIAGYTAKSQAMVADGFNSLGDVFASVVTLAGSVYAAKPSDQNHVFGHGKAEYIAAMIIGFSMVAMGIYMVTQSASAIMQGEAPVFSWWLVFVAGLTIGVKLVLFIIAWISAKKHNSMLIRANALDHRNDVFVSAGTLAAVLLSAWGATLADGLLGVVISVWIVYTGISILRDASRPLMDENMPPVEIAGIRGDIEQVPGVDHVDSVVAKPVGAQYILVAKVSVDHHMSVEDSHEIAKQIENRVKQTNPDIEDVLVHINPDFPHEVKT
ncbi:MAG: cation diffusion facilitator family transporter [Christensenellaceae bacterium]|jgi:cation diffusion facilitator family transporter